ncbi:glycoside hydrolase family 16 protein [Curtobacterium caseinilyticum]|uniref:Glycoside hydrolase family 16 protein n=1 Tax=Curtobacterium caseinilyticum TaxID=3055137 RepID=A0ABT7TNV5_9MICO|nr:glycoside hydrolase family 16 protein [Curtobacterium caseinilyticum]MDM7891281.1 glycoside hydrolase family 16 protein [Curtobacterium caseinilyticum]
MKTSIVAALTVAVLAAGTVADTSATLPASAASTANVTTAAPKGNVVSNGRTWKQTYRQDFTTAAPRGTVAAKYPGMGLYDGFSDTSGQGRYAPSKVLSVQNGVLDFWLRSDRGQPLAAAVMPDGYKPHRTGRLSIRYKTTKTPGYKFVVMLWPSSDNWNEGEIDWPEAALGNRPRPASAVPGTMTARGMTFQPERETFAATDTTAYHVATTEWDRNIVRFYWDGKLVASTTKAVPTKPMRVTLQAETDIGVRVPATASGHVSVDWVAIYD